MSRKVHALALLLPCIFALSANAAEIHGVIAKVDVDKKEVVLEARGVGVRGTIVTLVLDKDSTLLIGQQPAQIGMLAPGKNVRIVYEVRNGKNVVQTLHLNALGAAVAKLIQQPPGGAAPAMPALPALAKLIQQPPGGAAPAMPALPSDPNTATGKLQRLAITDREITVIGPGAKGPETETNLVVPEGVKITRGDKAIKLEELKEGEFVAVKHQKKDGRTTAESIQVVQAGAVAQQPQAKPPLIGQARKFLQIADGFLQQMEQGGGFKIP